MADFFEVVKKRQSIRNFEDKEVPKELIEKIIDAGRLAPSALNNQPWDFVVVIDKELKKKIREIYTRAREAMKSYKQDTKFVENGTIIVVCSHSEAGRHLISTSLAIENMLLAATAINLGSVVMTAPVSRRIDIDEIRELLKIPGVYDLVALVIIGYSDEKPKPKPKRDLGEIIHVNKF